MQAMVCDRTLQQQEEEEEEKECSTSGRDADGGSASASSSKAALLAARSSVVSGDVLLRGQQKPAAPHSLRALLRREARRRKLRDAEAPLEEGDLRRIMALLEAHALPPPPPAEQQQQQSLGGAAADGGAAAAAAQIVAPQQHEPRIDYDGFAQAATACLEAAGAAAAPLFQASAFLQFERDGAGAISLPLFASYASQHANALQLVRGAPFHSGTCTRGMLGRRFVWRLVGPGRNAHFHPFSPLPQNALGAIVHFDSARSSRSTTRRGAASSGASSSSATWRTVRLPLLLLLCVCVRALLGADG